jgi:hypothetical protein
MREKLTLKVLFKRWLLLQRCQLVQSLPWLHPDPTDKLHCIQVIIRDVEVRACAALTCCFLDAKGLVPLKLLQLDGLLSTCQQRCQLRLTCTVGVQRCMHASDLLA